MDYLAYQEKRRWDDADAALEYHSIDSRHPRYQMPLHWHMESELIAVRQGTLRLTLDEKEYLLHAGDAALAGSGVLHGAMAEDCVYQCLVYRPEPYFGSLGPHDRAVLAASGTLRQYHPAGSEVAALTRRLFDTVEAGRPGCTLQCGGLLMLLYGVILRDGLYDADASPEGAGRRLLPLKDALALIHEQYARPLTLEELAGAAGMSARYFCRYFFSVTHRTPIEYLNYYRIECAADRLLAGDESVTDVALTSGFNDVSYFIRTFRRYKGMTPGKYKDRKMNLSVL